MEMFHLFGDDQSPSVGKTDQRASFRDSSVSPASWFLLGEYAKKRAKNYARYFAT
jgi:hypothetical protein